LSYMHYQFIKIVPFAQDNKSLHTISKSSRLVNFNILRNLDVSKSTSVINHEWLNKDL
jgi:hypothetical protein